MVKEDAPGSRSASPRLACIGVAVVFQYATRRFDRGFVSATDLKGAKTWIGSECGTAQEEGLAPSFFCPRASPCSAIRRKA